jgi:hypothetical protein
MADRLIAWLDRCGYEIVEKDRPHNEASFASSRSYAELSTDGWRAFSASTRVVSRSDAF